MRRDTTAAGSAAVLGEGYGIEVVGALGFENGYAPAMRGGQAEQIGIRRIGDLAAYVRRLVIGSDCEFFGPRWGAIRDTYELALALRLSMDPSLMYQAAVGWQLDVITTFSTDGLIVVLNLVVLEDEHGAPPPYDAMILAGPRLVHERPDTVAISRGRSCRAHAPDEPRRGPERQESFCRRPFVPAGAAEARIAR